MSKYKKIDISKVKTIKFDSRDTKSEVGEFGAPFDPTRSFSEFINSLPKHLRAKDLLEFAGKIARAKFDSRQIIWMMGAHPLKVGLAPIINDLVANGFISHLAVNGAFIIHDTELAFFGRTSEEVAGNLGDGRFGMVEETPKLLFDAAAIAKKESLGLGEGMGKFIAEQKAPYTEQSVAAVCYRHNVPLTVHIAVGTDTIVQHPGYDGAVFGKLSTTDFQILCDSVSKMAGGAIVNFGSAVILPEVFLKAITVARNIKGPIEDFCAANFDMIQHYRPNANVVTRPVAGTGKGYSFTGHHEIMMPLLASVVKHFFAISGENSNG